MKQKTIYDMVDAINKKEELHNLYKYVAQRYKHLSHIENVGMAFQLKVGNKVRLKDSAVKRKARYLLNITGKVVNIKRVKATVDFNGTNWTVPCAMLTTVEE